MKRMSMFLAVTAGASCLTSSAHAAGNPYGPDYHSNCTAGFAVSQTLGGEPGATELATVAMPPKSDGPRSDVGWLSSTNCE